MADVSWLFGSNVPTSVTSSTQSAQDIPIWMSDFTKGLAAKAVDAVSKPYEPYGNTRIQPFDPYQTQAFQQVSNNQGNWQPALTSAQSHAEKGMAPFSQQALQPFLSPYISGVVDEMGRLGTRQYQEQILPQTLSPFVGAGQFGSTRSMDFANRAARDFGADLAGRQGMALQTAYDSAMKSYGDWSQRNIQGAQQLGALGQLQQQLGITDAQALQAAGQQRQMQGQQALDIAYQNFLQQRDFPQTNLAFLNSMIRGLPVSRESYTTQSALPPAPASPLAQAGAASTGLTALRKILGIG